MAIVSTRQMASGRVDAFALSAQAVGPCKGCKGEMRSRLPAAALQPLVFYGVIPATQRF